MAQSYSARALHGRGAPHSAPHPAAHSAPRRGGAAPRAPPPRPLSKYCRIFQWVEQQDADFAGAIRDLCLEGALSPGGRSVGITFLFPTDKKFRTKVADLAYSEGGGPDEAVTLIESLIIPDIFREAKDFNARAAGNRLGYKFTVDAPKNGSSVAFKEGFEIAPVADFRTLQGRESKIAIWQVTGQPPHRGDKKGYIPPRPQRHPIHLGGGGDDAGAAAAAVARGSHHDRTTLARSVEGEFDACMLRDRCASHNPYLGKVVTLLRFLKVGGAHGGAQGAACHEALERVLPVLDPSPEVTFYLVFEPHKTSGDYLVPDNVLFGADGLYPHGAWGAGDAYSDAVGEYKGFLAEAAGLFGDRNGLAAEVDRVRQEIFSGVARSSPKATLAAYAALERENAIGGASDVLKESSRKALGGHKKLWQDEFRFTISDKFDALRRGAPAYSSGEFRRLAGHICHMWPGNNYEGEMCLSNLAVLKASVSHVCHIYALLKFVGSTDFLYFPVDPAHAGPESGSMDPRDENVYNRNALALKELDSVRMHRPGLSPQATLEVQLYLKQHGVAPAGLAEALAALAAPRAAAAP